MESADTRMKTFGMVFMPMLIRLPLKRMSSGFHRLMMVSLCIPNFLGIAFKFHRARWRLSSSIIYSTIWLLECKIQTHSSITGYISRFLNNFPSIAAIALLNDVLLVHILISWHQFLIP